MTHSNIPSPRSYPILQHAPYLMGGTPISNILKLCQQFESAGVFSLRVGPREMTMVFDPDFMAELCDENRYRKVIYSALDELRAMGGDGLFTAHHGEVNWEKAHRILAPGFSAKAMKDYLPQMKEVAGELIQKWKGSEGQPIEVADDMTRLTLDTISLCGFDYRFYSFRHPQLHPFLQAMGKALKEVEGMISRPPFMNTILGSRWRYQRWIREMNVLVDQVIKERQKNPNIEKNDFLNLLLNGTDRKTGEGLSSLNIRYQILTFLIAGHETTSGLLSFVLYEMLKNPVILEKAQKEADAVLGKLDLSEIVLGHVSQLKYIQQILSEGLRLYPTAPIFTVAPFEDQILGGKYRITKDRPLAIVLGALHRSKKYWGSDPQTFNPDHFLPESVATRPAHVYRPFGNGQRACIGRNFALAEAALALGLILKNFDLFFSEPYELKIKETLTIKPDGLRIRVKNRVVTSPSQSKGEAHVTSTCPYHLS